MTASRPLGARAGLVTSLLCAASAVVFLSGPGCMPATGDIPPDLQVAGATSSTGSRVQRGSGGAVRAAGGGPVAGAVQSGGAPPAGFGGAASGGGDPPGGGGTNQGTGGGFVPGGMPNVAGACNVQLVDPNMYQPCTTCMGGHCVNPADYPDAPASLLAPCDQGQVCLPDPLVATKGKVLFKQCASVSHAEGRCTSLCIPATANLAGVLPQDVCASSERCAPCFNPVDGSETGLCRIGCDPGPTTQPVLFPQCCSGKGRCVPRADIPDSPARANLTKETCTGSDDPVCIPTASINDPTYKYPTCKTSLIVAPGQPGACIPGCFVNSNPLSSALKADNCADKTDKCVPCTDPQTGMPSGACG